MARRRLVSIFKSSHHTSMHKSHPYDALIPDVILDAVETYEMRCTGAMLALNSFENRVYRVETEERGPVVVKFYRPQRWTDEAIAEEHEFTRMLAEHEIPVVAPLVHPNGKTLNRHAGFRFALYPWQPGRAPELNTPADREVLGRFMGRLHRLGRAEPFRARQRLTVEEFGEKAARELLASRFIPAELREPFQSITGLVLGALVRAFAFAEAAGVVWQRVHGDCHLGNILWSCNGPFLVDFDDCTLAPAVQDIWMLLSGDLAERERQLADILAGYTQFMDFNVLELRLIEPLRTLRILHYNAWLARRWDDPAFPRNFPWFPTQRHWEELILTLREQLAALDEGPLEWRPQHG